MLPGRDSGWLRPRRARHCGARGLRGGQEEVRQRADHRGGALRSEKNVDTRQGAGGLFGVSRICSLFLILLVSKKTFLTPTLCFPF